MNFVRGEDSFVRAQWARRPFVWQIYPQADDAHLPKLDAALAHVTARVDHATRAATERFWHAWNGAGTPD
ncbi:elongation factor P maturation arginine rhamnosyltransferase EarP [Burkholderia pseudomallei]